jgi:hypothetical protein
MAMDTKTIIKWGAIAVGAYLLYSYLRSSGALDSILGPVAGASTGAVTGTGTSTGTSPALLTAPDSSSTSTAAGTNAGTNTNIATGTGSGTQPSSTQAGTGNNTSSSSSSSSASGNSTTRDLVAQLAKNDSYLVNGTMPFEHWSYYYNQTPQGLASPAPDPATAGIDPSAMITVDQWWSAASPHLPGVSGLTGLYGIASLSRMAGSAYSWRM